MVRGLEGVEMELFGVGGWRGGVLVRGELEW